jgi:hypothetical protein
LSNNNVLWDPKIPGNHLKQIDIKRLQEAIGERERHKDGETKRQRVKERERDRKTNNK